MSKPSQREENTALIKALCRLARATIDAWEDSEEAADAEGRTAIEKEHAKAVNEAMDTLVGLIPESEEPFYEGYAPVFAEERLVGVLEEQVGVLEALQFMASAYYELLGGREKAIPAHHRAGVKSAARVLTDFGQRETAA